jgi:hypothetical protein
VRSGTAQQCRGQLVSRCAAHTPCSMRLNGRRGWQQGQVQYGVHRRRRCEVDVRALVHSAAVAARLDHVSCTSAIHNTYLWQCCCGAVQVCTTPSRTAATATATQCRTPPSAPAPAKAAPCTVTHARSQGRTPCASESPAAAAAAGINTEQPHVKCFACCPCPATV